MTPDDQATLEAFINKFIESQQPLDADIAAALNEHFWELFEPIGTCESENKQHGD